MGEFLKSLGENNTPPKQSFIESLGIPKQDITQPTRDYFDIAENNIIEPNPDLTTKPNDAGILAQERLARNQSIPELAGKALAQAAVGTLTQVGEGIGYLADFEQHINLTNGTEKEFGNWFSDWMKEANKTFQTEVTPIHLTQKAQEGFSPTDATWWASNFPSVVQSLSLLIPATGVAKGASLLGKATKLIKTESALMNLEGLTGAAASRYMENTMEAAETANQSYQKALEEFSNTESPNYIEDTVQRDAKARELAGEAGRETWLLNSANLLTDIPQYISVFKGFGKGISSGLKGAVNIGGEGLEELNQYIIQQESIRNSRIKSGELKDDGSNISNRVFDYLKDENAISSAFWGALGGGVFQAAGSLINRNRKAKEEVINNELSINRANLLKDRETFEKAKDKAFIDLTIQHIQNGKQDQLIDDLNKLKSVNKEEAENLGLDDNFKLDIQKRIDDIKFVTNSLDRIALNKEIVPETHLPIAQNLLEQRLEEKRVQNLTSDLNLKYNTTTTNIGLSDIKKVNTKLSAIQQLISKFEKVKENPIAIDNLQNLYTEEATLKENQRLLLDNLRRETRLTNDEIKQELVSSEDASLVDLETKKELSQRTLSSLRKEYINLTSKKGQKDFIKKLEEQIIKENPPIVEEAPLIPEEESLNETPTLNNQDIVTNYTFNNPYTVKTRPLVTPVEKQQLLSNPLTDISIKLRPNPYLKGQEDRNRNRVKDRKSKEITSNIEVKSPDFETKIVINGVEMEYLPYSRKYVDKNNNLLPITETTFKKLVGSNPNNLDYQTFKADYEALKAFEDALQAYWTNNNKGNNKFLEVPKEAYKVIPIGQLDFASFDERPDLEGNPLFNNNGKGPIIFNAWNGTFLTDQITDSRPNQYEDSESTFALATLPNGIEQWVKLHPKTLKPVEQDKLLKDIQDVLNQVKTLKSGTSLYELKGLSKSINTFIATTKPTKEDRYIRFNVSLDEKENKYRLQVAIIDYTRDQKQKIREFINIPDTLNSIDELVDLINTNKFNIKVNKNSFKKNIPLDLPKSDKNVSLFTTATKTNVLKDFNIKFQFNPSVLTEKIQVQPKQEPAIKTTKELSSKEKALAKQKEINDKLNKIEKGESLNDPFAGYTTEEDTESSPFKISETKATEIINIKEAEKWLKDKLPDFIEVKDVKTVIDQLQTNGIVWGTFQNNIIYLSRNAQKGTEFHEAFHAVFRLLLKDSDIQLYLNRAKQELGLTKKQLKSKVENLKQSVLSYNNLSDKQLEELVYEEYMADRFSDWQKSKAIKTNNIFKVLFAKIKRFIDWLINTNPNIEDLFHNIDRGAFRNSEIQSNQFKTFGSKDLFKILPGKNSTESDNIIRTIAAKLLYANDNGNKVSVAQLIQEQIDLYDPDSEANKAKISDLPESIQDKFTEDLTNEWAFYSDPEKQKLITEQVNKVLKSYNYDPQTEEVLENEESEEGERNFEQSFNEKDPTDKQIKKFVSLILYDTKDKFGNNIKEAVDGPLLYNTIQRVAVGTPKNKILSRLKALAKYNSQTNALYTELLNKTGYDEKNYPNGVGLLGEQFLTKFYKAFELEKVNYLQVVLDNSKENKFDLYSANINKRSTYNRWNNNFTNTVLPKILNSKTDYKKKLITDITQIIELLQGSRTKVTINGKNYLDKSNATRALFENLGFDLSPTYLEFSLGSDQELKDEFAEARPLTVDDIIVLKDLIQKNINPFSKSGMSTKLQDISDSDALFREDQFEKIFTDANGKSRYSFVRPNHILSKTREIKEKYSVNSRIEEDIKNNSYNSYNYLLNNRNNNEVKQIFKNLDIALTGDIREEEGNAATFKTIDPASFLVNIHALFSKQSTSKKEGDQLNAYFVPSIFEANRSSFTVKLPINNNLFKNNEITEEGLEILYNTVFLQEYNRLKDKFGDNFKVKKWINLDFLNNNQSLSKKILKSEDISTLKPEILQSIKEGFTNEIGEHKALIKRLNIENALDSKFINEKYGNLDNYIGNFYLNDYLNSISYNQLIQGDLSLAKNSVDRVKRNSGELASGISRGSTIFKVAYITDTKVKGDSDITNKEITADDAQVFSTVKEKKQRLKDFGRLTPKLEVILDKLDNGEFVSPKEIKDAELDLISEKTVTYGNDLEGNAIYHKMSDFTLTKQLTSYKVKGEWVARPGKEALHNRRVYMEIHGIDQLIPESASKMFTGETLDHKSFEKDIPSKQPRIYEILGENQRLQVENHSSNSDITYGTQLLQLIDTELPNTPENQQLRKEYYDTLAQQRAESVKFALSMLVKENGDKANISRFLRNIRESIDENTPDTNVLELFSETNDDFKYDPNLPQIKAKFEQLFLAHFKDGVLRSKISGVKATLVTSAGYNVLYNKQTGAVINNEEFDKSEDKKQYSDETNFGTRELKIHKLVGDKIEFAEVAMTRKQAALYGLTIGEINSIDPKILTMFGHRIPTQSHHSMIPFKVVEFLPEYYGSVVIVPKEVVYLAGSDFDVDSLFIYRHSFYKDGDKIKLFGTATTDEEKFLEYKLSWLKNKEILREIKTLEANSDKYQLLTANESSDTLNEIDEDYLKAFILITDKNLTKEIADLKELFLAQTLKEFGLASTLIEFKSLPNKGNIQALNNKLVDINIQILTNPELAESLKTPTSVQPLQEDAAFINQFTGKEEGKFLHNGINGKIDAFTNNKVGSQTVGNAANTTIASASLTKHKVDLNSGSSITIDGKTYNTFAVELEDDVTFLDNKVTEPKIGVRRKNETLSTMVSAITDNAKERLSSKLNLQIHNLSQIGVLQALGIGRSRTMLIANQPVIVEFNQLMERSKAAIGSTGMSKKAIFKELEERIMRSFSSQEEATERELNSKDLLDAIKNPNTDQAKLTQLRVLELFKQLDEISNDIMKLNNLLKINKGLGTSFEELEQIRKSIEEPTTTFDINKIIENDSNIKGNIENYKKIIKASEKFIIKQTPGFINLFKRVNNNLNDFLTSDQTTKVKNDLQTFLSLKALNLDLSKYNNLLYVDKAEKTLGEDFRQLLNIEEFNVNSLIQYITTELTDITDLVKTDSRTKLSPKTIELFTDSYKELQLSPNKDINKFADNMFLYLIVKDNLQFKNDSFIKFIAPQRFLKFSQAIRQLNIDLQDPEAGNKYYKEFIEIFARNTANRDLIRSQKSEPILKGEKAVKNPPNFFYKTSFDPNTGYSAKTLYKLSNEGKYELTKTFTNYNGYLHQNFEENLKISQKPKSKQQILQSSGKELTLDQLNEQTTLFSNIFAKKGVNIEFNINPDLKSTAQLTHLGNKDFLMEFNPIKKLRFESIAHEASHIYIDALGYNHPLVKQGIRQAKENHPELWIKIQERYKHYNSNEEREKELLVTVMGKKADINFNTPKQEKSWLDWIEKFFKKIGEVFGIKPDIAEELFNDIINENFKVELNNFENIEEKQSIEETPFEKQVKYIEKRISNLIKKQKEFKEGTKEFEKLQEEIDLINQEYDQFQETGEGNFLFNLGQSTLDRVEDYINSFEEDGTNIDFEKIEHSKDVLETWEDFDELSSRAKALKKRLFPFENSLRLEEINKYKTEKFDITQEMIDNQDKDIRRLTKWTGTLSDVPNYIVRTIGSIIKSSQNKISTTNKQLTDKIQTEVDLLANWAKKNNIPVKDMYNQIIEERNGTLKLKIEKPIDPDLLRFYNFYQSTLLEAEDKIPQQIGKYYIPNIKTKTFKGALQKLSPFMDVKFSDKTNREELFADIVPSYLTENLPADQKSHDLGAALLTFAGYANTYEEMSNILPKVRVMQAGLTQTMNEKGQVVTKVFKKSSQPKDGIDGEQSNLYKMVDDYIEMQVKGKMKKVEGRVRTGPLTDENGKEIGETVIDFGKLGDTFLKYNSLLRIGLSPITAVSNLLFGDISNFVEAIGGRFYTVKDLHNGGLIFAKQTFDKEVPESQKSEKDVYYKDGKYYKKSVLNKLLEEINPLQELDDYEQVNKVSLKSKMSEEKLQEYMYSMQKKGEKWLQSRTMLAMMLHDGFLTKEGELTKEGQELLKSESEINKLRNKIQRLNDMIHGRYSQREAATLNQYIGYRLISQFRKWIPAAVESRIGEKQYDSRLGIEIEGRYRTLSRFIFSKDIMSNFAKMAKGELSELEMYNMRKNLTELVLLGASALAFLALSAGSDEERKRRLKNPYIKTGLSLLNRVSGDLLFFYSPTKINELGKNAIPLSKTLGDLAQAFEYIPYAFYIGDYKYKKGSRKGENKFYNTTTRLIPGIKLIPDIKRLANNQPLEELR